MDRNDSNLPYPALRNHPAERDSNHPAERDSQLIHELLRQPCGDLNKLIVAEWIGMTLICAEEKVSNLLICAFPKNWAH
jgi:hypothetical protein